MAAALASGFGSVSPMNGRQKQKPRIPAADANRIVTLELTRQCPSSRRPAVDIRVGNVITVAARPVSFAVALDR